MGYILFSLSLNKTLLFYKHYCILLAKGYKTIDQWDLKQENSTGVHTVNSWTTAKV